MWDMVWDWDGTPRGARVGQSSGRWRSLLRPRVRLGDELRRA